MIGAVLAVAVICGASIGAGLVLRRLLARAQQLQAGSQRLTAATWRGLTHQLLGPDRWPAALVVWLMLLDTALALAGPWPVKVVIDQVLGHHRFPRILARLSTAGPIQATSYAATAGLVLLATDAVVGYLVTYLTSALAERAAARLRVTTMSHLMSVPTSRLARFAHGELVSRVNADTVRVADTLVAALETLVPELSVLAGMITITGLLDARLMVLAVAVIPVFAITARIRSRSLSPAQRHARDHAGQLAALTTDLLCRIPAVQIFHQAPRETEAFTQASDLSARSTLHAVDAGARFSPVIDTLPGIALAAALIGGAVEVRTGHLTVGGLVVFLAYLSSLTAPVRALTGLWATIARGTASRDRLTEILTIPPLTDQPARPNLTVVPTAGPAHPKTRTRPPALALHNVSYSRGPGHSVLTNLSLTVPGGEIVCLAGPSGAGKTTILALLCRLIEPDAGHLTIGGRDLRSIPLAELRQLISLVPQDPWLHTGSIADNIRYGRPEATDAQVLAAAQRAGLAELIRTLPAGHHTQIGEHGHRLSGGQQRRLAIARALLRATPILLLDEPSTGLDQHAETHLTNQLAQATPGRTVILITHQPNLAAIADRTIHISAQPTPLARQH